MAKVAQIRPRTQQTQKSFSTMTVRMPRRAATCTMISRRSEGGSNSKWSCFLPGDVAKKWVHPCRGQRQILHKAFPVPRREGLPKVSHSLFAHMLLSLA